MTGIDADEFDSVPESEHVENFFDGLLDSIGGNESMALTSAQVYVQGVLFADGTADRSNIAGNEGFFSTIGDGIKKAWDYVVKMFKSIWGFFFKTEKEKLDAKVEKIKTDLKKKTDMMAKGEVGNVDATLAKIKKKAESSPHSEMKDKIEKALDAKDAKVKRDLTSQLINEEYVANLAKHTVVREAHDTFTVATGKLLALKEKMQKESVDGLITSLQVNLVLEAVKGLPDASKSFNNLQDAKNFIAKVESFQRSVKSPMDGFAKEEDNIKKVIDEVQTALNGPDGKDAAKAEGMRKKIIALKGDLSNLSQVISCTTQIYNNIVRIGTVLEEAIVIVI